MMPRPHSTVSGHCEQSPDSAGYRKPAAVTVSPCCEVCGGVWSGWGVVCGVCGGDIKLHAHMKLRGQQVHCSYQQTHCSHHTHYHLHQGITIYSGASEPLTIKQMTDLSMHDIPSITYSHVCTKCPRGWNMFVWLMNPDPTIPLLNVLTYCIVCTDLTAFLCVSVPSLA